MSQAAIIGVVALMAMCCSSSVGAFFLMGDEGSTGPTGPTGGGGGGGGGGPTATQLTDGVAHAYDSTKTYACTSGKEIGCANMNSAGSIMNSSGVYTSGACPNPSEFVYCMNPKTTTMAQYSDNTATASPHRLAATGSRCPTATNANCQDDQSIAGSGTGNTRKITSNVQSRQCVDQSYLYC